MPRDDIVKFIQGHFTDGLVLVIGSGLSTAEGIAGMPALADRLKSRASDLKGSDPKLWNKISAALDSGDGLEAALLKHPPSESMEEWITKQTCDFLLPQEHEIIAQVVGGERTLRLTEFLARILKPANGLPIITPNYDRLIEVGCEMAGFHVDTTAIGIYGGSFDQTRSCMGSCRGITNRGKATVLDHFPRAVVLKPHGSFDWYRKGTTAVRCSLDLRSDRQMITPGLNKYKAGYSSPFDKHREIANNYIEQSARLLVVGYGFNDDHLQNHLLSRIRGGTPTLILTYISNDLVKEISTKSPNCVCLERSSSPPGFAVTTKKARYEVAGLDLWDLGVLAKEVLE